VGDHAGFLDGVHVALVLTDPPYGVGIVKSGQVHQDGGRGAFVAPNRQYAPVHGDDQPFDPRWLTKVGDNQIIFGGGYFGDKLTPGAAWLCWDNGVPAEWSFSGFELAWTSFKGHYRMFRHTWSGMTRKGPRAEELKDRVHPTQKPVGLFADILTTFTTEGDLICDPYLGSGTTIIAAERLGRRCYAMEIEPRYCDVSIKRWEDYTGQKAVKV
jgi:site-specific DNA-methyltransferase (adenine-specific)